MSDEHKEQRRLQILEAAERVFIRKGYEPTTMKDIVEEAAMSRGWIYLYFQTKEEIFASLLEKLDRECLQLFSMMGQGDGSIWETLEASFIAQKEEVVSLKESMSPVLYEYFLTGWRDERRQAILRQRSDIAIQGLAELLQAGVDRGEFVPTLPIPLIARISASFLEGIHTHSLAIGAEQADASAQLDALIAYMKTLLGVGISADDSN